MIPYYIVGDDGRILRSGLCEAHMVAAQAGPGETAHEGEASDALHYLDGGVLSMRPSMSIPPLTVAPMSDWRVPDAPPGTMVAINGAIAGEADQEGVAITFPEAGLWPVDLDPPFPWRRVSVVVTVA